MVKNKFSFKNVRKKKTAPISFLCLISVHIPCIFRRLSSRHFSWTFLWTFYPVIFHGFSSGHFIRPFFMDFPLDILSCHFSWTFLWTFYPVIFHGLSSGHFSWTFLWIFLSPTKIRFIKLKTFHPP